MLKKMSAIINEMSVFIFYQISSLGFSLITKSIKIILNYSYLINPTDEIFLGYFLVNK